MSTEQDKLLAYLDNRLSDAEKIEVENALAKDPALATELATYQSMNEFLSDQNAKEVALRNLKNIHAEMTSAGKSHVTVAVPEKNHPLANEGADNVDSSSGISIKSILKLIALVIGTTLFFYLGYQFINKGVGQVKPSEAPELLYASNFDPDDISFATRGEAAVDLLADAAQAFNAKDYRGAVEIFDKAISAGVMTPRATYSYAIALIAADQTEQGRLVLEELTTTHPIYKDDALWYIAMSHLAEGQKEGDNLAARSALAKISKTSKWYKQAFALLDDLGE